MRFIERVRDLRSVTHHLLQRHRPFLQSRRKRLALDVSLYKLLQILSVTLFEKTPISIAVFDVGSQFEEIDDGNQLQLFDL